MIFIISIFQTSEQIIKKYQADPVNQLNIIMKLRETSDAKLAASQSQVHNCENKIKQLEELLRRERELHEKTELQRDEARRSRNAYRKKSDYHMKKACNLAEQLENELESSKPYSQLMNRNSKKARAHMLIKAAQKYASQEDISEFLSEFAFEK